MLFLLKGYIPNILTWFYKHFPVYSLVQAFCNL